MPLLTIITNLGMGGSRALPATAPSNRILNPRVQSRTMLAATVDRTITPRPRKRTLLPKVN